MHTPTLGPPSPATKDHKCFGKMASMHGCSRAYIAAFHTVLHDDSRCAANGHGTASIHSVLSLLHSTLHCMTADLWNVQETWARHAPREYGHSSAPLNGALTLCAAGVGSCTAYDPRRPGCHSAMRKGTKVHWLLPWSLHLPPRNHRW